MATLFDSPWLGSRLQRAAGSAGRCDCVSYSYLGLSLMLFAFGTTVTVLALGDADGRLFSKLGHMWLVGPVFICSGMMIAVKSMLYLRRRSVIQMLLHQRAVFQNIAAAQAEQALAEGQVARTASTSTLPPSYEALIVCEPSVISPQQTSSSELPPPSYEEAMFLMGDEKITSILEIRNETISKESNLNIDGCQNLNGLKP